MKTFKMAVLLALTCGCAPSDDDEATLHLPVCVARKTQGSSNMARWQLVDMRFASDTVFATLRCSSDSVEAP